MIGHAGARRAGSGAGDPDDADRLAVGRLAEARGAGARARRASPICCCSTSRPTTSTSRASSGSRRCCAPRRRFATVTVTHDRLFLQRVATRILELDRRNAGGLLSVAGDYATYVRVKAETMHAQERREVVLRNTLRRETEWLRRGAAARTTKQQARIQRAGTLADEVAELATRNQQRGRSTLDFEAAGAPAEPPDRGARHRQELRRARDLRGVDLLLGPGVARRSPRPQRLRQVDADPRAARRGGAARRHRRARRRPAGGVLRSRTARRSIPTRTRRRHRLPRRRLTSRSAARACTCAATSSAFSSRRADATCRSASSRAASRAACCWRS